MIEVKLKHSRIGIKPHQRSALRCLGLKKIHQVKKLKDNPSVWGQIRKVKHLIEVKS